jgi:deoxyribodipyrimidine photolyase
MHLPKQMSMHKSFQDMPNSFTDFAKKIRRDKIHPPYGIPTEYYSMPFPVGLYSSNDDPSSSSSSDDDDSDDDDVEECVDNTKTTTTVDTNTTTEATTITTTSNMEPKPNPLTYMPTLQDLGYTPDQIVSTMIHHPNSRVNTIVGGETAGMRRVQEYIWDLDLLKHWSTMRELPILQNKSTLWSPYLAHGCISPRDIAVDVKRCYTKRRAPKAMTILQLQLKMRDYNKFFCIKHGDGIFQKHGALPINRRDVKPKLFLQNPNDFHLWKMGRTGYPLVDATMREILHTGYATDRCRFNAASFLVHDMKHDWRRGAQYFEEQLIDYDVYSNWWVRNLDRRHFFQKASLVSSPVDLILTHSIIIHTIY